MSLRLLISGDVLGLISLRFPRLFAGGGGAGMLSAAHNAPFSKAITLYAWFSADDRKPPVCILNIHTRNIHTTALCS